MTRFNLSLKQISLGIFSIALMAIVFSIYTQQIGLDGGFYLSIGRNLWQDHINYFNIASSYNPLGMMILGLPYSFSNCPIALIYGLYFIFVISDTILFFLICRHFRDEKNQALLISSVFLLYTIFLDGHLIILEPLQLFFILIAVLLSLKERYLFSGIFCFGAFLTKQYSLALMLPLFLGILINKNGIKIKFIQAANLILGFAGTLGLFYLCYAPDINWQYFIQRMLGKVPELLPSLSVLTGTGEGYGISVFFSSFLKIAFFLPLIWIPLFTIKKNKNNLQIIVLMISFCSVFLFAAYFHYFLLILPWMLLLLHTNLDLKNKKIKFVVYFLILTPTFVFGLKTMRSKLIISSLDRSISANLKETIPQNSKVYLVNVSMAQYAYNNYQSIDLKNIGYAFPNIIKKEAVIQAMPSGSYLIADDSYIGEDDRSQFLLMKAYEGYSIYLKE